MEVTPGAEIQDGRFNLFKVQQGRTGNSEKEAALPSTKAEFTSPPSLFKTGLPPSRLVRQLITPFIEGIGIFILY